LNLTAEQKAAIKSIRESTRQAVQDANSPADKLALINAAKGQIKALLTPEQLAKLAEIRQGRTQAGQNIGAGVLAQLNLTEKQKLQIAVIRERTQKAVESAATPADKLALIKSAWDEIKALLTPEQLAQLQEIRKGQRKSQAGIVAAAETAAALNLTDEQKATIKSIRESTRQAVQAATSPADKRAIRKAAWEQIKGLLTPEQLAELKKTHPRK
jgi:Spy/CpxP family protein refolding chaperone